MIKEDFTYTDYDGNKREEVCYFNLNAVEVVRLDTKYEDLGGIEGIVKKISVKNPPRKLVLEFFETLILTAYGIKSDDGRALIKRRNGVSLSEEFSQTEAYNILLTKITSSTEAMANFFNGLVQKSDIDRIKAAKAAKAAEERDAAKSATLSVVE
jgi:hypothetical protein